MDIYKVSLTWFLPGILFDKRSVVSIRDETDILAVRFLGNGNARLRRNLPNRFLIIFSHRHPGVGKLILGEIVERISLVFSGGIRIRYRVASVWELYNIGVMPGRDLIRPISFAHPSSASHFTYRLQTTQGFGVLPSRYSLQK